MYSLDFMPSGLDRHFIAVPQYPRNVFAVIEGILNVDILSRWTLDSDISRGKFRR